MFLASDPHTHTLEDPPSNEDDMSGFQVTCKLRCYN